MRTSMERSRSATEGASGAAGGCRRRSGLFSPSSALGESHRVTSGSDAARMGMLLRVRTRASWTGARHATAEGKHQ